jgi:hypothetical protein
MKAIEELMALILKHLPPLVVFGLKFLILSFHSRDCSLQVHTCSYLCIPPDVFINHPGFLTYYHTADLKKKPSTHAHSAP